MEHKCEYCKIPGAYGDILFEGKYWQIYLAPSQRYLGTCVVVLKRYSKNLRELETAEWIEFSEIVKMLEECIKKTFNPTLFNWSCFMNSAYRVDPPNPEVHWHLIPRYNYNIIFEGLEFTDPDFGYIPRPIERKIPKVIMDKIISKLKKNLRNII